jgi:2,3-bisphosphoglycerate-independent phosphoglycerate mutase
MKSSKKTTIFVFLDGIGFGKSSDSNPFKKFGRTFFSVLGQGSYKGPGTVLETDAQMGIGGAPQSATGQTALFTGYNGPQILGRHVNGYPTYSLRPYLKNHSIFCRFKENGKKGVLLNSFTDWFLKRMNHPRRERLLSASVQLQLSSGEKLFTMEDYEAGNSLYMDLTNWFLRRMGHNIPMVNAKTSGKKLVQIARKYDLAVFEYFFTDKVGHEQSMGAAKRVINHIEDFFEGIYEELDPESELLIASSDHGNLEDLSIKTHTENPVPTFLFGRSEDLAAKKITRLYDIPRYILSDHKVPFEKKPEIA